VFNRTAFVIDQTLTAIGVMGLICGGSARDTLLGRADEIKDFDVVVFNGNGLYEDTRDKLIAGGVTITEEFSNAYAHSNRFAWCIKTRIVGQNVDIIGLKVPTGTDQEIVTGFDFDINACYFTEYGHAIAHYPDSLKDGHRVQVLEEAELSPARTAKFIYKFPQFDWSSVVAATDKDNQ
jgi:hypothetical protein